MSDLAKSAIADTFDQQKVFNPPKRTVTRPVFNYFFRECVPDVWHSLQHLNVCRVYVHRVCRPF
jgi:hypothetical protein